MISAPPQPSPPCDARPLVQTRAPKNDGNFSFHKPPGAEDDGGGLRWEQPQRHPATAAINNTPTGQDGRVTETFTAKTSARQTEMDGKKRAWQLMRRDVAEGGVAPAGGGHTSTPPGAAYLLPPSDLEQTWVSVGLSDYWIGLSKR